MDRSRGQKRATVAEAADRLGISKDAVRARIKRGTIDHERDEAGNVFVYVPWDADQEADQGGDDNVDQPTTPTRGVSRPNYGTGSGTSSAS